MSNEFEKRKIALRMDDIFASSKQYEVYSNRLRGMGNFLFLKYLPYFKNWGPYREMNFKQWQQLFSILAKYKARLTVAVTACWVTGDSRLVPFFEKFPNEAKLLKEGLDEGLIEIANHGLTHCIVGKHRPLLFGNNREYHREFNDCLSGEEQKEHLYKSQKLLQDYFQTNIITFVPPGNMWTPATEKYCFECGIETISSSKPAKSQIKGGIFFIGSEDVFSFHDRDIVLGGLKFFEDIFENHKNTQFVTINDMVQSEKVNIK